MQLAPATPATVISHHVPEWVPGVVANLVRQADELFDGESVISGVRVKRGPERKAWVRKAIGDLLRNHDLRAIPDWIETPAEELVLDVVVETVLNLVFPAERRARERARLAGRPEVAMRRIDEARE